MNPTLVAALGRFSHVDIGYPGDGRSTLHFDSGCEVIVSNPGVLDAVWPALEEAVRDGLATPPDPKPTSQADELRLWQRSVAHLSGIDAIRVIDARFPSTSDADD
jgi:hypothetical protein